MYLFCIYGLNKLRYKKKKKRILMNIYDIIAYKKQNN